MKRTYIIIIALLIILFIGLGGTYYILKNNKVPKKEQPGTKQTEPLPRKDTPITVNENNSFNLQVIKKTNELLPNENYLISPYSMEVALNLLKRGASTNTLDELNKVLPNRTINNISINSRIGEANALFIKDKYQNYIEEKYMNELQTEYGADIIYDKFTTPKKLNEWTKEKTNGMIPELVETIDPDFVLSMANAIVIDVDWQSKFDCTFTRGDDFTANNITTKVEMMHQTYENGTEYFKTDNAEGVVIPYSTYNKKTGEIDYEAGKKLEFIALLPNKDIKEYIKNMDDKEFQDIDKKREKSSHLLRINVSLPRFTYDFNYKLFKEMLIDMGITNAFSPGGADFTNIISRDNQNKAGLNNIFVSEAIHKTHIELNENGTKAAAVTAFTLSDNAAYEEEQPKYIYVAFNKPFIYMIRDQETKELLFFGTVYYPNEWKGETCEYEE